MASKKYKFDPEKLKSDIKAGFKSSQTDYSKKPTSNSKTSSNKTNTKKQVIGNDALSRNNPAFAYLQNEGGGKKIIKVYRLVWVAAVYAGSVVNLAMIWNIADCMNALMAIPNLISLLLLSGVLVKETNKYLWSGNLDEKS